jgi:hypothetical protein
MWDVPTQRETEAPPLTASRPAKCRPREVGPHGLIPIAAPQFLIRPRLHICLPALGICFKKITGGFPI